MPGRVVELFEQEGQCIFPLGTCSYPMLLKNGLCWLTENADRDASWGGAMGNVECGAGENDDMAGMEKPLHTSLHKLFFAG